MEQVQNQVTATLNISELSFEIAPEIKKYFEDVLKTADSQMSIRECEIIFPDKFVDRQSLLSLVIFEQIRDNFWEIRNISIYQVIAQGQSTEFVGKIDGESCEFDVIEDGYSRENLLSRWQVSILLDIKYQQITDEQGFNSQHLKLLRSTGHEVVTDFEEQKPHLCEA